VRTIAPGEPLGAARGEVVVCVPVYGALDLARDCLASVRRNSDADLRLLVADDATPGSGVEELAEEAGAALMRQPSNVGFVENANAALRAAAPADVVLLNSDCVVTPGWLDGLRAAAGADSRIATVSALTNEGTVVSVPDDGRELDALADAVRAGSLRLRPRLPTAIGHCVLIRRAALELAGDFDPAFSPGYGEEVDFSQRCLARGMAHVLADDVYVRHQGAGSFGAEAAALRERHERLIDERWPHYAASVRRATERGALPDALAAARRSLRGLTVTIDGGALGPQTMGTQVTTLALARALAARGDVHLRVVVPDDALAALEGIDAEVVSFDEVERGVARSDVVHRPAQVVHPKDLDRLHRLGERIVITVQDLIAYSNPTYFRSFEEWDELRAVTRQAAAVADAVVFISAVVRAEAETEQLAEPDRARVIAQGVDHDGAAEPRAPAAELGEGPLLVCIGTDFAHKNRVFAIRMLRELGREATLVLAGPHMEHGSTRAEEDAVTGDLRVVRLGEVTEAEKAWLLREAALVLYPTVSEGFGLVPFEAARAGTPCMFAPVSSLPEVAGAENATLVAWDAAASAERARTLLDDEGEARRLVDAIAARGAEYTWERTAAALADLYREVGRRPPRAARSAYFGDAMSDVALSLVGPGGQLPPEIQRALLGIAARPRLRRPAFAAIRAGYRAARRLKRGREG
jgi:glycosyltransferase involved in cell wall biosynthesis